MALGLRTPPLLPTSSEDDSDEEYGDEVTDDENPEEVVDKYEDFQDSIDSYLDYEPLSTFGRVLA